jgi:hypothetical protein
MLRKYLSFFGIGALVCGGMLSLSCSKSEAAVMTPPFATDTFHSGFEMSIFLQPTYTGLPFEVEVTAFGVDAPGTVSTVLREVNAFSGYFGTDTINTEFISMHLAGSVVSSGAFFGTPVQFKVGQNNGFLPGLGRSPGQVAENIGTPLNGLLDVLPAKSIFDLCVDVWVDINLDGVVDIGEVMRNFNQFLRMKDDTLQQFPPLVGDSYISEGWLGKNDLLAGEFGPLAMVQTSRIDFFVVDPDGTNSGILAFKLDPLASHKHTITPEPTSMVLFGGLMVMPILRRFRRGNRTLSV